MLSSEDILSKLYYILFEQYPSALRSMSPIKDKEKLTQQSQESNEQKHKVINQIHIIYKYNINSNFLFVILMDSLMSRNKNSISKQ